MTFWCRSRTHAGVIGARPPRAHPRVDGRSRPGRGGAPPRPGGLGAAQSLEPVGGCFVEAAGGAGSVQSGKDDPRARRRDGCRRRDLIRVAPGLLLGLHCSHRRGGDREWGQCVQAPAWQECCNDARDPRRDRDHALHRRFLSRRSRACPTESDGFCRFADRPCDLSLGIERKLPVLRGAGDDTADSRPRREHILPRFSSPRSAAGSGQLRSEAVHEPR